MKQHQPTCSRPPYNDYLDCGAFNSWEQLPAPRAWPSDNLKDGLTGKSQVKFSVILSCDFFRLPVNHRYNIRPFGGSHHFSNSPRCAEWLGTLKRQLTAQAVGNAVDGDPRRHTVAGEGCTIGAGRAVKFDARGEDGGAVNAGRTVGSADGGAVDMHNVMTHRRRS